MGPLDLQSSWEENCSSARPIVAPVTDRGPVGLALSRLSFAEHGGFPMTNLDAWKAVGAILLLCAATAMTSSAQTTFESLLSFDGANGASPFYAPVVQGADGNLYGTTSQGGRHKAGTVFKMTPAGELTTIHDFCGVSGVRCLEGSLPWAGVIQSRNGNLYGTTVGGGAHDAGTVYEISPAGKLTTLYSFCAQAGCADGAYPEAGLVQATDGNFYGTTNQGGDQSPFGHGTVFKITPSGRLTTLHRFCAQAGCADGEFPYTVLVQAEDGGLYGTTSLSGTNGYGTLFRITRTGRLTTLHSFGECDNGSPGWLVLARDGNLYGTTVGSDCTEGTVFRFTRAGQLTTLYYFCSQENCADGAYPYGLTQGSNGQLYGTASQGGDSYGDGTIFEITALGQLTTLHTFDGNDGSSPTAGVVQARNGKFYGTTSGGGNNNDCCGTVFSLDLGLPTVER